MCDVYGEAGFNQKNVYKLVKHGFANMNLSKRQSVQWKHTDSPLKTVQRSVKKVMLTFYWDMKKFITIDFLEKGTTVNSASFYQFLRQKFTLFIEWPL